MTNEWDCVVWETATVPEENEVRIRVEGRVSEIDDRMFRKFEENEIQITKVSLTPEGGSTTD